MTKKTPLTTTETRSILFADVAGFGKVTADAHVEIYIETVINPISRLLENFQGEMGAEVNTWGDAFFALFPSPVDCCRFAIQLRDHFRSRDFEHDGLSVRLGLRVAVHQGMVCRFKDPIRKVIGSLGRAITLTARIEPIVDVGAVWATDSMKGAIKASGLREFEFDELGVVELAKGYGELSLYHVRKLDERRFEKGEPGEVAMARDYESYMREARLRSVHEDLIGRTDDPRLLQGLHELYRLATSSAEN